MPWYDKYKNNTTSLSNLDVFQDGGSTPRLINVMNGYVPGKAVDNTATPITPMSSGMSQVQLNNLKTGPRNARERERKQIESRKNAESIINQGDGKFTLPNGETKDYSKMNFREQSYVKGEALKNRGRFFPDENSIVDDFNPLNWYGSMAANMSQAPYNAQQTNSYIPYVTSIAEPLIMGRAMGSGSINPLSKKMWTNSVSDAEFANNLLMGVPKASVKTLSKLPFENVPILNKASRINPWRFKTQEGKIYRQVGKPGFEDALKERKIYDKGQKQFLEENPNYNYLEGYNEAINAEGFYLKKPPPAPFFSKDKLFFPIDRKATGKGFKKTANSDAEYLIEGSVPDEGLLPRYMDRYLKPGESSTNTFVLKPEYNNLENFNLYKRNWLEGYSKIKTPNFSADNLNVIKDLNIPKGIINTKGQPFLISIVDDLKPLSDNMMPYIGRETPDFKNKEEEIWDKIFPKNRERHYNPDGTVKNSNTFDNYIPSAIAIGAATQEYQKGGIITDPMGQWAHPGQVTRIPSSDITMKGVDYPVYGVGDNGHSQMMYPGAEYSFPGAQYVDEYPILLNNNVSTNWTDKYKK